MKYCIETIVRKRAKQFILLESFASTLEYADELYHNHQEIVKDIVSDRVEDMTVYKHTRLNMPENQTDPPDDNHVELRIESVIISYKDDAVVVDLQDDVFKSFDNTW